MRQQKHNPRSQLTRRNRNHSFDVAPELSSNQAELTRNVSLRIHDKLLVETMRVSNFVSRGSGNSRDSIRYGTPPQILSFQISLSIFPLEINLDIDVESSI